MAESDRQWRWRRRRTRGVLVVLAGLLLAGLGARWCLYSTIGAVSPDGRYLARVTGATPFGALLLGFPLWYAPIRTRVEVVDRTTGRRGTILTYPEWDFLGDGAHDHWLLLWHPDSRRFLYVPVVNIPAYYPPMGYRVDGDPPVPKRIDTDRWVVEALRREWLSRNRRRRMRARKMEGAPLAFDEWVLRCSRLPADMPLEGWAPRPAEDGSPVRLFYGPGMAASHSWWSSAMPHAPSASLALGWTDRALYIRICVDDERSVQARRPDDLRAADSLWVALRPRGNSHRGRPPQGYEVGYAAGRAVITGGAPPRAQGLQPEAVRPECRVYRHRVDDILTSTPGHGKTLHRQTLYGLVLPWSEFGMPRRPQLGDSLDFGLVIRSAGDAAAGRWSWFGDGPASEGQPPMGELLLVEAPATSEEMMR